MKTQKISLNPTHAHHLRCAIQMCNDIYEHIGGLPRNPTEGLHVDFLPDDTATLDDPAAAIRVMTTAAVYLRGIYNIHLNLAGHGLAPLNGKRRFDIQTALAAEQRLLATSVHIQALANLDAAGNPVDPNREGGGGCSNENQ